jgi:hypothetical protein
MIVHLEQVYGFTQRIKALMNRKTPNPANHQPEKR